MLIFLDNKLIPVFHFSSPKKPWTWCWYISTLACYQPCQGGGLPAFDSLHKNLHIIIRAVIIQPESYHFRGSHSLVWCLVWKVPWGSLQWSPFFMRVPRAWLVRSPPPCNIWIDLLLFFVWSETIFQSTDIESTAICNLVTGYEVMLDIYIFILFSKLNIFLIGSIQMQHI